MEINIINHKEKYKVWVVEEEEEKYYKISLKSNRAIISAISKSKVYLKDNQYYSDWKKSDKEFIKFAFASFKTINLD